MTLLAAVLLGASVWCAVLPPADPRVASLLPTSVSTDRAPVDRRLVARLGAGIAAVGALAALPVPVNVVASLACWFLLPRVLGRLETRRERRRADDLARQAPVVADLLAATLSSGAPMRGAVSAVSAAVAAPAHGVLAQVVSALDLGADPAQAWQGLLNEAALAPLAGAVVRSSQTGAPLSGVLGRLADDLRRERRSVVEVAARTAGVRAVVPLAACFLPAFILLGVVPVVAALANELISG